MSLMSLHARPRDLQERARTKDRAGGGPAEERAWTRGRDMRLLGIEEARVRDDSFSIVQFMLGI